MQSPINDPLRETFQPQSTLLQHAIEVSGLTKSFGKSNVLEDLQLDVLRGEFLVVLGDSGSGKSTLLKLITGLERQRSGSIRIHGMEQSRIAPHRRDVAIVFQDGNGYDHLTVRKNLALIAKISDSQSQITEWIERLRIGSILEQRLDQLSGGESQRVAIARAMLSNKSIILLDEPLSHLNQSLREEIRDLILMVHRESKKTFVYVTHDSDEAFYMANRIAVLDAGKIQQVAEPRSVYRTPISKSVASLLGQPTIDILKLPRAWFGEIPSSENALIDCGVRCHDWSIKSISVEPQPWWSGIPEGFVVSDSKLILSGSIQSCRWMGSRWLIDVGCQGRVRIVCDSIQGGINESVLIQAERLSRAQASSVSIGHIEASCAQAMIQTFRSLLS